MIFETHYSYWVHTIKNTLAQAQVHFSLFKYLTLLDSIRLLLLLILYIGIGLETSAQPVTDSSDTPSTQSTTVHTNVSVASNSIASALSQQSFEHVRALPIFIDDALEAPFTRYASQDKEGYLWFSGISGLVRYDGYHLEPKDYPFPANKRLGKSPILLSHSNGDFFVGDYELRKYNYETDVFDIIEATQQKEIHSLVEDDAGKLWLAGDGFGYLKVDPSTGTLEGSFDSSNVPRLPDTIHSAAFDIVSGKHFLVTRGGLFEFNPKSLNVRKISTPLDGYFPTFTIKDISIVSDKRELWIGTQRGLLIVKLDSYEVELHTTDGLQRMQSQTATTSNLVSTRSLKLPINSVNTTFVDRDNNVWLGFEKLGVCQYSGDNTPFMCLEASTSEANKLPVSTVEDIYQDNNGTMWFAMNYHGPYRMSLELEKFKILQEQFNQKIENYFPSSFGGVVKENGDVWIATDGGGINVYNYKTGDFFNLKHDPKNPNTLSSDSVISLSEDEYGFIWAGTWAGGVSRINPDTHDVQRFLANPNVDIDKSIYRDYVFVVAADQNDGVFFTIWKEGLQHYNFKTQTYTNYLHKLNDEAKEQYNIEIVHLQIFNDKLFIAGEFGLEYLDLKTDQLNKLYRDGDTGFHYVLVESETEIWLGGARGLVLYDMLTGSVKKYDETDGLTNNRVHYITKDELGNVWVATKDGVSILDVTTQTFKRFYHRDGLVGKTTSPHGEFIKVDGKFFIPSNKGVTIADPTDLPFNSFVPKTVITDIEFIGTNDAENQSLSRRTNSIDEPEFEVEFANNSLRFEFSSLSFIFPEENKFKYRLLGWQDKYVDVSAQERFATYTNLPTGKYTFEVYSANSSGVWDPQGAQFSFYIKPAWWTTWWAFAIYIALIILLIYGVVSLRLSLNLIREKQLKSKVKEKTQQLEKYAHELESSSKSLAKLNNELEERVLERTRELQQEVNEKKAAEDRLVHLAFHDSLTELANRECIVQRVQSLIEQSRNNVEFKYGVMFLDGDRFKQINDTYGHIFGDRLLIACAKRLNELTDVDDFVGRLGGDEFTVVSKNKDEGQLMQLAAKIVEAFAKPFEINNQRVVFNVSIGVLACDSRYKVVPDVLKNADIAMYRAKEAGKGTYRLFDAKMQQENAKIVELELGIRQALNNQEFSLAYQPIVNLKTGLIESFEALIRWQHDQRGFISPAEFIPIAEEAGLIWDIGKWVLQTACSQAKAWENIKGITQPKIAVNLSTHQLQNPSFMQMVDDALEEVAFDTKLLTLELTESVLIENTDTIRKLYDCVRRRKIDLAIDDFGTGYSSLAYLREIPAQVLKIDRGFIAALDNNSNSSLDEQALSILQAVIALGQGSGKLVTAEGIETKLQLQQLINLGCDFAQGYYMAKPLSFEDATQLLKSGKALY